MQNRIISILTPTYNRAATYLPQTIESIQNQQEDGFVHEHIIVDNASSDNTQELVEKYSKKDSRIKYIRNLSNEGPAGALNKAFSVSRGDLVLPLDDDDLLPYHSLQMHFDFMKEFPSVGWSYGYAFNITEDNKLLGLSERVPFYSNNSKELFQSIFTCNTITNGSVILRRESLEQVAGWDINVASQDWDLWLKLSFNGTPAGFNKNYLSFYRVHTNQLTTQHSKDGTWDKDREYFKKMYTL